MCPRFFLIVSPLFLLVPLIACEAIGIGGECHDPATYEVLKQVQDVNGELWPVEKHPQSLKFAGETLNYCAISMEAVTENRKYTGQSTIGWRYVFHPDTGDRLEVSGLSRGMRTLKYYVWE